MQRRSVTLASNVDGNIATPCMMPVAGLMRRIGRTREFVQFYSCMHIEHTLDGPRICIREHGRELYSIMALP